MERAKAISRFYKVQGEKNRSHIESLIKSISNGKSIKPVNFIVDSVMLAEVRNALLLGVHDLDRIEGDIVYDGREATVRNRPGLLTDLIVASMAHETEPVDVAIFNGGSVRIDDVITVGALNTTFTL